MEAKATLSYARISPRKVGIVCDLIRGKSVAQAQAILMATPTPGPILKRMMPRAQGRGYRINKRTSHITVVVSEKE